MTDIKIFKSDQIGGSVTMISAFQARIVIDYGKSVQAADLEDDNNIDWGKVDAVFFTSYNMDHIGRFDVIPENVSVYMSSISYFVLYKHYEKHKNRPALKRLENNINIYFLNNRETVTVKDISVTPYIVDNSAFWSFMFLIKTPGKTILYTGGFRDQDMIDKIPPGKEGVPKIIYTIENEIKKDTAKTIDALIIEGTAVGAGQAFPGYTACQMSDKLERLLIDHRYIFAVVSPTDADTLYVFQKTANKMEIYQDIGLYVDDTAMEYLKSYESTTLSYFSENRYWNKTDRILMNRIYSLGQTYPVIKNGKGEKPCKEFLEQRELMRENGFMMIMTKVDEELLEEFADLNPVYIYAMSPEYVKQQSGDEAYGEQMADFCKRHNVIDMHLEEHAYPDLVASVIECVNPVEAIMPIHTNNPEAFRDLSIRKELKKKIRIERKVSSADKERLYKLNEAAADYYSRSLWKQAGKKGLDFLALWEITDNTIKGYGLGYAGKGKESIVKYLKEKGFSEREIVMAGLACNVEGEEITDRFHNRIMFPIKDRYRRIVGFAGRAVGDGNPKYEITPSSPIFEKDKTLFGIWADQTQNEDYMIICDEYMTALVFRQLGLGFPVVPCSWDGFPSDQDHIIRKCSGNVVLCIGNENLGKEKSEQIRRYYSHARILDISPYSNPVEYIWGEGRKALEKKINKAIKAY